MEQALLFIEEHQVWIYLLLLVIGLGYLRLTVKWLREVRRSMFSLERERAVSRMTHSAARLALVLAVGVAVFVVATFVAPSILAVAQLSPQPTEPSQSQTEASPDSSGGEPEATLTTLPLGEIEGSGCLDPDLTLAYPQNGDILSGVVIVRGTANIPNFGFYKFEYRSLSPEAVWRPVAAGLEPKINDELGSWDTTLVTPGEYAFQLVVTDTEGIPQEPCVVLVRVVNP
ncbi:MAG: hypothetical protein PVF70_11390 [Anaerolineales bacterium]|jgi:hypothetical protein